MSKTTRFQASNGHTGQVKHDASLTDDQVIALVKSCYKQLENKDIKLIQNKH